MGQIQACECTSTPTIGHTQGLVLGHAESAKALLVIHQARCCFVVLKCSTSSFYNPALGVEKQNGNLRDRANHWN